MKEVIVADHAGFCFGVRRAVDAIVYALAAKEEVWSIGMPIHNAQEVARLSEMGLKVAETVDDIPPGVTVLVRAHGEPRAVFESLREKGLQVVDMTCPFVRKAQMYAEKLSSEGFHVVLLGDARHPEIRSIMGYVDGSIEVITDVSEAENLSPRPRIALISQTTQKEENLTEAASVLVRKTKELYVCNTICRATVERQTAVRSLSEDAVDGIVIVGGRDSANTAKLRDIAQTGDVDVIWIESSEELDGRWAEGKDRIGIAAGASTPQWLINEVRNKIARM
ncbi:MAG: 4-hydroxy-3-methylbut-2-enyl diphosphate reductase [Synergistaceae bacterium]|nr:4-hydroxy-3-methylbut-2-enyl diphosphate reductase [Synergistaceae bacterium]